MDAEYRGPAHQNRVENVNRKKIFSFFLQPQIRFPTRRMINFQGSPSASEHPFTFSADETLRCFISDTYRHNQHR